MSRRKLAKAKGKRVSAARAAQAAKREALDAKELLASGEPRGRLRRVFSFRTLREGLLTFGAVAGVFCMLLAIVSFAFDIKPVIFRSGSMSPAIDTGALAISHTVKAKDIAIGDVVTVKTDAGIRVTHRVKDLSFADGKASLVLKGDANKTPDATVYVVASADRVLFDVPKAGYVASWLSGPTGIFVGGLLAGLLVVTAFAPSTRRPKRPGTRKLFGISIAMVTVGLVAGGIDTPASTQAFYSDTAAGTSGTFTAGNYQGPLVVPPAPVITSCTPQNGQTGDNFVWTWANTTPATLPANTQFKIVYSNFSPALTLPSPATQNLADNTAPYAGTTIPHNENTETGDFVLVVTTPGGTSAQSNKYRFTGKNNGKTCVPVP
ncbi:hypothetical protein GCM10022234_30850 [Aeromicrobium panaciterrae]|uniref:signal peptidase I n=1 Tax=Aeromicrobium panaciterrae TaxID=363861 RepID=UPI0031D75162